MSDDGVPTQSRQFITAQKLKTIVAKGAKFWACDRCYRLKNKCDAGRPTCAVCARAKAECTYERRNKGRGGRPGMRGRDRSSATTRPARGNVDGTRDLLRTRLYEIDEQVRTFNVSRPQPTEYELPMPPNYMMNQAPLQSPTYYPSDPYEAYIPHQSSVPSPIIPLPSDSYMSPQPTALNHLQTPYQQPHHAQTSPISLTVPYTYAIVPSLLAHPPSSNMLGHSGHVPLENLQRIPLPNTYSSLPPDESLFSEGVITYLMQNFFLDTYPSWYPCPIHQESFMSKYPNQPPLLIYAMCAATARRSDHPVTRTYIASRGLPWYLAGEPYFWKARQIIAETHIDNSYESVLSLVTLGVAIAGMGDTESYISLMSMAIQSALALRYDIDPDVVEVHGQLGWLEKESRRRLWWMLCLFDRQPKPGLQNPVMYPMIHNAAHPSVEQYTFGNMSRVKVPAPEALWQSVRDVHGLPAYESFLPDYDVDCVALAGRLTEVFFKIQRLPDHAAADVSHVSNASDSPILAALSKFEGFAPAGYNAPIPGEPTSFETETMLAVELQAIIGALPDWARDLTPYSDFSTELVSRNPPPVQLLIQHIVYHCLMICLHLNIVLTGVDALKNRAIGVHDNVTPMQHEAYTFCRHHAGRVADLLRKLLAYNPTGRWVDWFSLYLVFRSALVLIVALKAERDREGLIQAHQDLEVHLELIRAVGRHLWFGHYMTKIYEDIILNS